MSAKLPVAILLLSFVIPCFAQTPEWVARYDGPASGSDAASVIALDVAGYVYVGGVSRVEPERWHECTVLKYASDGELLWDAHANLGERCEPRAMDIDPAGNTFITGVSAESSGRECFTGMVSASGELVWMNRYDSEEGVSECNGIEAHQDGSVSVTGFVAPFRSVRDFLTIRYSASGEELWRREYDGDSHGDDFALSIADDESGCTFVTGASEGAESYYDYVTVRRTPSLI